MQKTSTHKLKSPCIGVCSTGIGDSVCRGCKRFCHEIIHWNAYSDIERRAIQSRLFNLLSQVAEEKLRIIDERKLRLQIDHQKIRHNPEAPAYCLVFDLLKAGASQIDDWHGFGIALLPKYQDHSPVQIRDAIDEDFYVLSSVHYERYFELKNI